MTIQLLAFGIAGDILPQRQMSLELLKDTTVAALKVRLMEDYPAFQRLASLAIAVDEVYRTDDYVLQAGQTVAIIPPVSGG